MRAKITGISLVLGLLATPLVAHATTGTLGGEQGHKVVSPGQPDCNIGREGPSTPSIQCTTASAASGIYTWQVPFVLQNPSTSAASMTATFSGKVTQNIGNSNQEISARMLVWNNSGLLTCANTTVHMTSTVNPTLSLGSGACSVANNARPEAEFGIGHIQNQTFSNEPRLHTFTYTF